MDEGDRLIEQCAANGLERRREAGEIAASLGSQGFATGGELLFPGREILVAGVLLQRRIPLAQGLVVAPPGREEGMFHVEHAPVEKSPAPARTFLEQLVDLGVDDLGRELLGEIRDASGNGAADMPFRAAAGCLDAERDRTDRAQGLAREQKGVFAVGDERIAAAAAKRAAPAQEKGGLEQAGLARGIRADEEIGAGIELELDRGKTAKSLGVKAAEGHPFLRGASASRRTGRC